MFKKLKSCILIFLVIAMLFPSNAIERFNKKAIEYEKQFSENAYNGQLNNDGEPYTLLKGSKSILISAPHAVKQLRAGNVKASDVYTGAIIKILADETDAFILYRNFNDKTDPNFDYESKYEQFMKQIVVEYDIELVIDLHGMKGTYNDIELDVDIGTNYYRNVKGDADIVINFVETLTEAGFIDVYIDEKFKASKKATISNYISHNTDAKAIQVEFSRKYRDPRKNPQNFNTAINSLVEYISNYERTGTIVNNIIDEGIPLEVKKILFWGYPENEVQIERNITRAELACVIYRAKDMSPVNDWEIVFQDSTDKWYENEAKSVVNAGYLNTIGSEFRGNQVITRNEFMGIWTKLFKDEILVESEGLGIEDDYDLYLSMLKETMTIESDSISQIMVQNPNELENLNIALSEQGPPILEIDDSFKLDLITRLEVAKMFYRLLYYTVDP